jgi:hypothetical protein
MVAVTLSFTAVHFLTSLVFSSLSFPELEDIPTVRDQNFQITIFDHAASHSFPVVSFGLYALAIVVLFALWKLQAFDRPSSPQSKDYK